MQAGALKQSIKFQQRTTSKDDTGHRDETWSDIASSTRPASIEPLTGKNYFSAIGQNSSISTKITIRFDSTVDAITPDNRIVDTRTGEIYSIVSTIKTKSARREIVFMCELKARD